jgi:hypothetical protein
MEKRSKEYYNEINRWKAKTFFLSVLRSYEGRQHVISLESEEKLADLLTEKLIQKVKKETT